MTTLTLIFALPLLAAIALAFVPRNFAVIMRAVAVGVTFVTMLLAVLMFWQFNGATVAPGAVVSAAQLGLLVYTPPLGTLGSPLDTFTFTVNDGTGQSTTPAVMSINVTEVNDPPVAQASTVTTNEDTAYTFKAGDFQFSDPENDALVSVTLSSLSLGGFTARNRPSAKCSRVSREASRSVFFAMRSSPE